MCCLAWATARADAQFKPSNVLFRNDLPVPVLVQGASNVNGMVRRGPPILIPAKQAAGDFNVPGGARFYSVYDANQPARALLRDQPVQIPPGIDVSIILRDVGGRIVLQR